MSIDAATLQAAANEIRLDASKMRAKLVLADHLESLASVENAIVEANTRLDRARELEEEQKAEFGRHVERHKANIAQLSTQADQEIRQRHALADAEIASKRAAADTETASLQAEARKALDDARDQAATIVSDAEASTKQHRDEVEALKAETHLLETQREGLKHDIAAKEAAHEEAAAKLASVEAKHKAAKESYEAFLRSLTTVQEETVQEEE